MTIVERDALEARKAGFDAFRRERMPVLHKFSEILGCPRPHEILITPEKFLPYISEYMQDQVVSRDNRNWLLTRIGYFVGELLVSEFDGCWLVDERVDSSTFSRYVIGNMEGCGQIDIIDPFSFAESYVNTPAPRNLMQQFASILN